MCVWAYTYIYTNAYSRYIVCICACVWTRVYVLCVYVCLYVHVCGYVHMSLYVCGVVCLCVHMYICFSKECC